MAGTGDILMSSNFELNSQRPLDARLTQADLTARDAIALVQRYDGLEVYIDDGTKKTYRLILGTVDTDLSNNNNWVDTTLIPGTTNISNFVNDANYTSIGDNISNFINDASYTSTGDNISVFTNDANYLTTGTLPSNIMVEGENISLLTNDAGYLTASQATETAAGVAELATQAETNAGTDDLRIVTPLKLRTTTFISSQIPNLDASKITSGIFAAARIPQATESAIGGGELATQNEVNAGTSTTTLLTPATNHGNYATDTRLGVVRRATTTEANNGTQLTFIDSELLQTASVDISDTTTWTSVTLINGHTGTLLTRVNRFGYTEIYGQINTTGATSNAAFTVPSFQRPGYPWTAFAGIDNSISNITAHMKMNSTTGVVNMYPTSAGTFTFYWIGQKNTPS